MSTTPRRLGRGLEALLGRPATASNPNASNSGIAGHGLPGTHLTIHQPDAMAAVLPTTEPQKVSVYEIDSNPYQPRLEFDEAEITSLAESLDQHGLLQPVVVRRIGERYQLIAGERRLRAAIKAGWPEVPVIIRDADDRQVAELAIVENLQRRDLNALEKAASFQKYLEQYRCTQEELAGRLAIDRSTVANLIRLLELPSIIQAALRSGAISAGHARALLPLGDDREQIQLCTQIQTDGLSVRAVEQIVQEMIHAEDQIEVTDDAADDENDAAMASTGSANRSSNGTKKRTRSANISSLEQQLRTSLGTKVEIRPASKGRGKIVVHFTSHDEFDRLRELLVGAE